MGFASITRGLLFASLALFSSLPHPAMLQTGGTHDHAVSFQYEHGQLHMVLRHHDVSKGHEAHDGGALASVVASGSHADHFLHALPAYSLASKSAKSVVSMFLPTVHYGGTSALPRIAGKRMPPPLLDPEPGLAARRTIVLIV